MSFHGLCIKFPWIGMIATGWHNFLLFRLIICIYDLQKYLFSYISMWLSNHLMGKRVERISGVKNKMLFHRKPR